MGADFWKIERFLGSPTAEDLGAYVCWSRMQAEAGQGLEDIVARKELERQAGGGQFLWGVGNAPAAATSALARTGCRVPVVFSIMKSKPKQIDVAPSRTVVWRRYTDATGVERALPPNTIVTSRGDSASGRKRVHYALMCYSKNPLAIERGCPFPVAAYRNASDTGAPVGASQVTALLRRTDEPSTTSDYEVNLRAWLTASYWVKLSDPVEVTGEVKRRMAAATSLDIRGWLSLAQEVRLTDLPSQRSRTTEDLLLL